MHFSVIPGAVLPTLALAGMGLVPGIPARAATAAPVATAARVAPAVVKPVAKSTVKPVVKKPAYLRLAPKASATNRRVVVDVMNSCQNGAMSFGGLITNNTTSTATVEAFVSINDRVQPNSWARLGRTEVKGAYLTLPAGFMVNLSTNFTTGNVIIVFSVREAMIEQVAFSAGNCAVKVRPSHRILPRRPLPPKVVVKPKSTINGPATTQGRSR